MKIKNIETKVWDGTKEDKEAIGKQMLLLQMFHAQDLELLE